MTFFFTFLVEHALDADFFMVFWLFVEREVMFVLDPGWLRRY